MSFQLQSLPLVTRMYYLKKMSHHPIYIYISSGFITASNIQICQQLVKPMSACPTFDLLTFCLLHPQLSTQKFSQSCTYPSTSKLIRYVDFTLFPKILAILTFDLHFDLWPSTYATNRKHLFKSCCIILKIWCGLMTFCNILIAKKWQRLIFRQFDLWPKMSSITHTQVNMVRYLTNVRLYTAVKAGICTCLYLYV